MWDRKGACFSKCCNEFPFLWTSDLSDLTFDVESSWKGLVKAGAIAFVITGIITLLNEINIFLLTFHFISTQGTIRVGISGSIEMKLIYALITPIHLPTSFESAMQFIANNPTSFQIAYALLGVSSLVLLIGIPALYVRLKKINPTMVVLASLFSVLSLVVIALTYGSASSLVGLSTSYTQATTDFQKAAFVAAYQSIIIGVKIDGLASEIALYLAFLVFSIVMMKSSMPKSVGVLGIAVSAFGVFAAVLDYLSSGTSLTQVRTIVMAIWYFVLAYYLWQV